MSDSTSTPIQSIQYSRTSLPASTSLTSLPQLQTAEDHSSALSDFIPVSALPSDLVPAELISATSTPELLSSSMGHSSSDYGFNKKAASSSSSVSSSASSSAKGREQVVNVKEKPVPTRAAEQAIQAKYQKERDENLAWAARFDRAQPGEKGLSVLSAEYKRLVNEYRMQKVEEKNRVVISGGEKIEVGGDGGIGMNVGRRKKIRGFLKRLVGVKA